MSLPVPYYQDQYVTLYCGDCRDLLPMLPRHDLLLTDPPYGIGESNQKNLSRVQIAKPKDYGDFTWDQSTIAQSQIYALVASCKWSAIFGGNYYAMPPSSCWLVWDKCNSGDFADGELCWTNWKKAVRIKRHMWNGMIREDGEARFHPTQKPRKVMRWVIELAPEKETILDPFAGSGTTGVAAKSLGLKCTLIEREERYCSIAARRIAQQVVALGPAQQWIQDEMLLPMPAPDEEAAARVRAAAAAGQLSKSLTN